MQFPTPLQAVMLLLCSLLLSPSRSIDTMSFALAM